MLNHKKTIVWVAGIAAVLAAVVFSVPQISSAFDILDIMQGGFITFTPTPGGGLDVQEFKITDLIGATASDAINETSGAVNNDIGRVTAEITDDFKSIFGSDSSYALDAVSELSSGGSALRTFDEILSDPNTSLTAQNILVNPYEVIEPLSFIDATFGPQVYDSLVELLTINGDTEALLIISGGGFDDVLMQASLDSLLSVQDIISESYSDNRDATIDALRRLGPYVRQNINIKDIIAVQQDRFNNYVNRTRPFLLYEYRLAALERASNNIGDINRIRNTTPSSFVHGIFLVDSLLVLVCVCGQPNTYFANESGVLDTLLHEILHYAVTIKFTNPHGDATVQRIFSQAQSWYPTTFFANDNSALSAGEMIAEYGSALAMNIRWRPPLLVDPGAVRLFNEFKLWLNQNGLVNIPAHAR